jgi:sugar phosphate isomerase/epimerase
MPDKTPSKQLGFHCENPAEIRERVIANRLSYVELYNIQTSNVPEISRLLTRHGLKVGVHCPLILPDWYPYAPIASFLLGDAGAELKELTLRLIAQTLHDSQRLRAEYVVVHFPKPAPAPQGRSQWVPDRELAWDSVEQLAHLARQFQIRICIEGFGERPFLSADYLLDVLLAFPELSYCFDTGHMHLAALRGVFDYSSFLERLAPRIGSVHLWNTRGPQDYAQYSHLPVHPSQRSQTGWADIGQTIRVIREGNPDAVFIFEHGTRFPSAFDMNYREGVSWVRELLAGALASPANPTTVC